jgi:hypothetical protein
VTEKLELTEAVRKAMAARLCLSFNLDDEVGLYEVDRMIAAAKGTPVGTIARRPDGGYIAFRNELCWEYIYLDITKPQRNSLIEDGADSWPVIYDPREDEAPRLTEAASKPRVFRTAHIEVIK